MRADDVRGGKLRHCPTVDAFLDMKSVVETAARSMRTMLVRQVASVGLNEMTFRLLWRLGQTEEAAESTSPGVSQTDLARDLQISTAQTSGLVESLRQRGLLEGHRPKSDRRRQVWRLSPAGAALLASLIPQLELWTRNLLESIDNQAADNLREQLAQLTQPKPVQHADQQDVLPIGTVPVAATAKRGAA